MYKVIFVDGTEFEGGQPSDSKWEQIPNKPIKQIEYSLTPFIKYRFTDFELYNHCVERVRGVNNSLQMISKVIIMGAIKNRVYQIVLDKDGSVYQTVVKFGEEYSTYSKVVDGKFAGWSNGKPLSGWKPGTQGQPKLEKVFTKSEQNKD